MNDPRHSRRGPRHYRTPDGDDRPRLTCPDCGYVAYENPRVVVASVAREGNRVLLCRRAIPPRIGYWCLPAGFLELHESAEEGACREAMEEAHADLELAGVLAVYSLAHINQVQIVFSARLRVPTISPGPESQDVALFHWHDIPWESLAFPSVRWALEHDRQAREHSVWAAAGNPEPARPLGE